MKGSEAHVGDCSVQSNVAWMGDTWELEGMRRWSVGGSITRLWGCALFIIGARGFSEPCYFHGAVYI